MLDIKFVRDNLDVVKTMLKNRNNPLNLDGFTDLEKKRREILNETEQLKTKRNTVSKQIGAMKKAGQDTSEISTVDGYNANGTVISKVTTGKGVYIEGNSVANSIIGSRFRDTITGGAGKDTMSGGHSSVDAASPYYDTFLYYSGSGNDVITDYIGTSDPTLSDVIKLANPNTTISTSALNTKKGYLFCSYCHQCQG